VKVKLRIVGRGVTDAVDVVVPADPELPPEELPVDVVDAAVVDVDEDVVEEGEYVDDVLDVVELEVVALVAVFAEEAEPVLAVAAACVFEVLAAAPVVAWVPDAPAAPACPPPAADLLVPPTVPIRASTWHLTVVLAALSIVPVSVT
jgi:hypothetical protein